MNEDTFVTNWQNYKIHFPYYDDCELIKGETKYMVYKYQLYRQDYQKMVALALMALSYDKHIYIDYSDMRRLLVEQACQDFIANNKDLILIEQIYLKDDKNENR